jgi:hypothetical protein
MNAITTFAFEDQLVRSVMRSNEPWFIGRDVCHVLDIRNESHALARLDHDERAEVAISDPSGAKMAIAVSEPGVFRLIFTSRKPEAERFKRWLAHEVLPKLRRTGAYAMNDTGLQPGFDVIDPRNMDATARMRCVDLAARLHGLAYARQLYREVGLPRVVMPVTGGEEEAVACLDHIMGMEAFGHAVSDLLQKALDEHVGPSEPLKQHGIWTVPDEDGFIIANRHPSIEAGLKGTPWQKASWGHVLRRLPGALATRAKRFTGVDVSRGTFLPATVLDLLE